MLPTILEVRTGVKVLKTTLVDDIGVLQLACRPRLCVIVIGVVVGVVVVNVVFPAFRRLAISAGCICRARPHVNAKHILISCLVLSAPSVPSI